jgi:hypothetical protein
MAGALTAAALGYSGYRWRTAYGPWQTWEYLPWTYTALFLADLIDLSYDRPGAALDLVKQVLLADRPAH